MEVEEESVQKKFCRDGGYNKLLFPMKRRDCWDSPARTNEAYSVELSGAWESLDFWISRRGRIPMSFPCLKPRWTSEGLKSLGGSWA